MLKIFLMFLHFYLLSNSAFFSPIKVWEKFAYAGNFNTASKNVSFSGEKNEMGCGRGGWNTNFETINWITVANDCQLIYFPLVKLVQLQRDKARIMKSWDSFFGKKIGVDLR